MRRIREKVRALPADCAKLFEDETDLLLFPPLRVLWFEKGKQTKVPITVWNAKRMCFGTSDVEIEIGRCVFVVRPGVCAPDYPTPPFRAVREAYGDRRIVLLLDKASRHTAGTSERLAAGLGIEQVWVPPRTTWVNTLDRLWWCGKDRICANRHHPDIDAEAENSLKYLASLSSEVTLRKACMLSGRLRLFRESLRGKRVAGKRP